MIVRTAAAALLLAAAAHAQIALGPEFLVNATTDSLQEAPDIAADAFDNFRVVWESFNGNDFDVRTRRIQANGALGTDLLLSQTTAGSQTTAAIDMTHSGDWVAAWTSTHAPDTIVAPFGRTTTADGTILQGELPFDAPEGVWANDVDVAAISDDLMVGIWRDQEQSDQVTANVRSRTGTDYGAPVIGETMGFSRVGVAGLYSAQWVAVWTAPDSNGSVIRIRCYEYDEPVGQIMFASPDESQGWPDVASDNDTQFVVVWDSPSGIKARVYSYNFIFDCEPATDPIDVSPPGQSAFGPRVGVGPDGGFVVTWGSTAIDADGGVHAREFTKLGTPVSAAFQVNTITLGSQSQASVDVSATQFVVAFQTPDFGANSPYNIAARRFKRKVIFTDGFETMFTDLWTDTVP